MGFDLVKVEVGPVREGGWAKHFFYRMEDDSKFIAFWELHEVPGSEDFETNISTGVGLPPVFNHIAFDVRDRQDFERRREQWLDAGLDVLEAIAAREGFALDVTHFDWGTDRYLKTGSCPFRAAALFHPAISASSLPSS